jgi:hypothetical protein
VGTTRRNATQRSQSASSESSVWPWNPAHANDEWDRRKRTDGRTDGRPVGRLMWYPPVLSGSSF